MKKRLFCLMLAAIMLFATVPFASAAFADVPANAWYAPNVAMAYEMGLVKGVSETEFNPNGNVTLAETVALACRLNSAYYDLDYSFVQDSVWYQVYLDYAKEHGILTDETLEQYNVPATRLQFAVIMAAALPEEALPAINSIAVGQIPDVPSNASVYRLYRAGILTGSDDKGTFLPSSNIKRSEVAAIVTRMAEPTLRKTFSLTKANESLLAPSLYCEDLSILSPDGKKYA